MMAIAFFIFTILWILSVMILGRLYNNDVIIEGMEVSLPTSLSGPPEAIKLDEDKNQESKKDTCAPCPPCARVEGVGSGEVAHVQHAHVTCTCTCTCTCRLSPMPMSMFMPMSPLASPTCCLAEAGIDHAHAHAPH